LLYLVQFNISQVLKVQISFHIFHVYVKWGTNRTFYIKNHVKLRIFSVNYLNA